MKLILLINEGVFLIMKYNLIWFALLLTLALCVPVSVEAIEIKLSKEGEIVELTEQPRTINGTAYVRLEDYVSIVNGELTEDPRTNYLVVSNGEDILFRINPKTSNVQVDKKWQSTAIERIEDQLYMPLRQINYLVGYYTAFDYNTNTILMSKQPVLDIELSATSTNWTIPSTQLNQTHHIYVPILCYHVLSDGRADTLYTPYWQFEAHLKAIKQHGYNPITPQQLYEAYYLKKPLPKKPILITFDDGYYDNYSYGYPLLKKYDMQATIFLITKNIAPVENIELTPGLPRLSWENVKAMSSHVTFQNHTYNSHNQTKNKLGYLTGMIATPMKINGKFETAKQQYDRVYADVQKSEDLLKQHLGYGSYIFSYPYGAHNQTTIKTLKNSQIPLAVTIKPGIAKNTSKPYELPRLLVDGNWSGDQLIVKLKEMN